MEAAIREHQARGGVVFLATFTSRHTWRVPLHDAIARTIASMRVMMRRGVHYAAVKRACKITGAIRVIDATWSDRAGWHAHAHVLLFADDPRADVELLHAALFIAWKAAAEAQGLRVGREHAVDVRPVDRTIGHLARYVAEGHTAHRPRHHADGGDGRGYSAFDLLRSFAKTGEIGHGALFREWWRGTRGRHQLQPTRHLYERLGVSEAKRSRPREGEVVVIFGGKEWAAMSLEAQQALLSQRKVAVAGERRRAPRVSAEETA